MVENAPLLSIVIPTKNRQEYVLSAMSSILDNKDKRLELVIQDNSDSPILNEKTKHSFNDSRIKYSYTPTPLSFIANFEEAVLLSTGLYICLIGDDDGVNPEILEATLWAQDNNIDALTPTTCSTYLWPGSGVSSTLLTRFPQNSGLLNIGSFTGKVVKTDPESEIRKIIDNGGQDYLKTNIPKLYHGIVRRQCLNNIYNKTGFYFGGLSPDIFVAIAVANFAKKTVSIDYPLTIPGACRASGSVQSAVGGHTGKLADAPHFKHRGPYEWSNIVPRYYSVPTIWADSSVAALKVLNREDMIQRFNYAILAAYCAWAHPRFLKTILSDFYKACDFTGRGWLLGTFDLLYSFINGPLFILKGRITNRLKITFKGDSRVRVNAVNDMSAATQALTNHLYNNGQSFRKCVSTLPDEVLN